MTARALARGIVRRLRRAAYRVRRTASRPLRLHLGCGGEHWRGYVNIDADPSANSDLRLDFIDIESAFPPATVAEVVMIHSLSYLRLWEARDLLAALGRLLEPGGRLVIEVPDLSKCARRALETEGDVAGYLEAVRGLYAFDLDQIARRAAFVPYAFGWSSWHLTLELERAGFRDVCVRDPQTHDGRVWRDTRIEAVK